MLRDSRPPSRPHFLVFSQIWSTDPSQSLRRRICSQAEQSPESAYVFGYYRKLYAILNVTTESSAVLNMILFLVLTATPHRSHAVVCFRQSCLLALSSLVLTPAVVTNIRPTTLLVSPPPGRLLLANQVLPPPRGKGRGGPLVDSPCPISEHALSCRCFSHQKVGRPHTLQWRSLFAHAHINWTQHRPCTCPFAPHAHIIQTRRSLLCRQPSVFNAHRYQTLRSACTDPYACLAHRNQTLQSPCSNTYAYFARRKQTLQTPYTDPL